MLQLALIRIETTLQYLFKEIIISRGKPPSFSSRNFNRRSISLGFNRTPVKKISKEKTTRPC